VTSAAIANEIRQATVALRLAVTSGLMLGQRAGFIFRAPIYLFPEDLSCPNKGSMFGRLQSNNSNNPPAVELESENDAARENLQSNPSEFHFG
jgi:hypothetical protein